MLFIFFCNTLNILLLLCRLGKNHIFNLILCYLKAACLWLSSCLIWQFWVRLLLKYYSFGSWTVTLHCNFTLFCNINSASSLPVMLQSFYYLRVHPPSLLRAPLMNGLHKSYLTCLLNRQPSCSWPGSGPRITQRTKTVKKRFRRSSTSKSSYYHPSIYCVSSPLTHSLTHSLTINRLPAAELLGGLYASCVCLNEQTSLCYHCDFIWLGNKLSKMFL